MEESLDAIFICMQIGLLRHRQVFLDLYFIFVRHYCLSLFEYHHVPNLLIHRFYCNSIIEMVTRIEIALN